MKFKEIIIPIIIIFLITSCTPTASTLSTVPTRPPIVPTHTSQPKILADFTGGIEGIGEHGNMACVEYQGNKQELEGLSIKADIYQGDKVIDSNMSFESIDGKDCFEMIDAKYDIGESVSLNIRIKSNSTIFENNNVKINIGNFKYSPFIQPLFYRSETGDGAFIDSNHVQNGGFYAHDYWIGKGVVGTPVHMPFSFQIIQLKERDGSGFETNDPNIKYNWNNYLYSPYTGFVCVLQHQQPGELLNNIVGNQSMNQYGSGWPPSGEIINYDPNVILFTFGPKDKPSSLPHLHIGCQIPNLNPNSFEPSFGFDDYSYGLCKSGFLTPCDGIPNIEIKDLFISSPIDENK